MRQQNIDLKPPSFGALKYLAEADFVEKKAAAAIAQNPQMLEHLMQMWPLAE